jgi:DNA-binding transcriptional LysR family regulator
MDTKFLESFVSVVANGSIAEAARKLNLTSTAVAQRIRALEEEMGVALVARSGRTVKPTEAGAAILERADLFLRTFRDLKAIASENAPVGELRLGAVSTSLTGLLPSALSFVMMKYPQIEIFITTGNSPDLYQRVLRGELDAAIIMQPHFALQKSSDWRLLREEPLVLLIPASMPQTNAHAILKKEPFIRYDRTSWEGQLIDRYLLDAGIQPHERFEIDRLEGIMALVDRGLGVSLLPDWAPPWPEGLSLAKLELPKKTYTRKLGLLWMRSSLRIRLIHALLEGLTGR